VALMEHRRFTPDHFRTFHPGGKLGAKLMKVADLMHGGEAIPLVGKGQPMSAVLLEMTRKGFGVAGVTDAAGRLVGIVTDGDLRRHMEGLLSHTAAEVMTRGPRSVAPGAVAEKAVAIMKDKSITCLFVVDPDGDGRPAGILNIHDCLRAGIV
jgi:arabinose-5-phosphate isomerase